MPARLPTFIRLQVGAHRTAMYGERLLRELLSATAWSWTSPRRRDELTAVIYAGQSRYLRGGDAFEQGLTAWEQQAIEHPAWPRSGRVLIGGAGGGREAAALAQRGYVVRAFDPLAEFATACADECLAAGDATCVQASYDDLVEAADRRTGPLAPLLAEGPFDAVLFGWGSLAHVTEPSRMDTVISAALRFAPNGPLVTSFYTRELTGTSGGRADRFARKLGGLFSALGAPGRRPDGGIFVPWAGFVLTQSPDEVQAMAVRCGYKVGMLSPARPQPWALFVPNEPSCS